MAYTSAPKASPAHWSGASAKLNRIPPSNKPIPAPISISASQIKRGRKLRKSQPVKGKPTEPLQTVIPAGFAFVVKVTDHRGETGWRYVTYDYGTNLGISVQPFTVYAEVTNEMHRFWKRVVIDGVFTANESGIDLKSMRLVEVHHSVHDVTARLFGDDDSMRDSLKLGALSKLSPNEARLLGVEAEYTLLRIVQSSARTDADEQLSQAVRDQQEPLGIERLD